MTGSVAVARTAELAELGAVVAHASAAPAERAPDGARDLLGDSLPEMQARFVALRDAIDRCCEGKERGGPRRPFALTVRAACLRARCE